VEEKDDQKNDIKENFRNTKGNFDNVAACMKVENEIMIRMKGGGRSFILVRSLLPPQVTLQLTLSNSKTN